MLEIRWKPNKKQKLAFDYLRDKETTELLYGGGAGGGKSHLGCVWLIYSCLAYPGTRWLMGRAHLKTLKESTLLIFFQACKKFGLKSGVDFKYNSILGIITWNNGSEIYLKDLFAYPSDPEFDELGSTEYTGAFIDEASQVAEKAYQIVMSRLRYKLIEYNLIPKLLIATNPTKNFIYREFYKPFKENQLKVYRKFVKALIGDNPYMPQHYIDNLNKLDNISKERLLHGNWEYDEDATRLFDYEKLLEMFNIPYISTKQTKYITADIARYGDDTTVICLWHNLFIFRIWAFQKMNTREIREFLTKLANENSIPFNNIVVDEDGIGGGIVDEMKGIRGFVNNSKPMEKIGTLENISNFQNLKSQCYFYLADCVNNKEIGIEPNININIKNKIIEDLEQVKRHNADKDGKLMVTPKEEIKESIGRSPDYGDAIMMRMLFLLKKPYIPMIFAGPKRF